MGKRKSPATNEEFLRAIIELFNEIKVELPEEIDEFLRQEGYDPNEVAVRMNTAAQRALANSPLNWRARTEQVIAEKDQLARASRSGLRNREDILNAIRELLDRLKGQEGTFASAHYRNFETATDGDLESLLNDLEYLAVRQQSKTNDIEKEE